MPQLQNEQTLFFALYENKKRKMTGKEVRLCKTLLMYLNEVLMLVISHCFPLLHKFWMRINTCDDINLLTAIIKS